MSALGKLLDGLFPYIPAVRWAAALEKGAVDSLCPKCAAALVELEAGGAEAAGLPAYALYWYDGLAARIVRGYKYEDKRWLSRFMGDRLAYAARCLGHFDAVCPVPLHKKRRRMRRFRSGGAAGKAHRAGAAHSSSRAARSAHATRRRRRS